MAQPLNKTVDEIARSIKQGKVDSALSRLRTVIDRIRDERELNRLGDLLARAGRVDEALKLYERIGEGYAKNGILPKAVAIYKKILRLVPDHRHAKLQLGVLYLKQDIRGEASRWLLEAAEAFDQLREFEHSLKVYETLAAADPVDPERQLKLAQARLAAGQEESAEKELCAFAERISEGDDSDPDIGFCRQAVELFPEAPSLLAGLIYGLRRTSRTEEALSMIDGLAAGIQADAAVRGEKIHCLRAQGRIQDALELLLEGPSTPMESVWIDVIRDFMETDAHPTLWDRIDPVLIRWGCSGEAGRSMSLLRKLVELKEPGYIPALKRLGDTLREAQESVEWKRVQSRLIRAYEAADRMEEAAEAKAALGLGGAAPESDPEANAQSQASFDDAAVPTAHESVSTDEPSGDAGSMDLELTLPKDKADRDFAHGRLAQSEAMEKYGLVDQALAQCAEVTHRFTGHSEAWERTTKLLLRKGAIGPLRDALISFALAQLAAGDRAAAMESIQRARSKAPLELGVRARLQALGLLDKQLQHSAPSISLDAPAAGPASEPVEEDVFIDFEAEDEQADEPEEIQVVSEPTPVPLSADLAQADSEEDDLSAIAAALESSFVDDDLDGSLAPESESEESIDEVFAAFKDQVAKEVDEDDHRTHYDLGIAYKEMGLLEEAVSEFEKALGEPSLCCEACTMIALLYRELEDAIQAVAWYRKALDVTAIDAGVTCNLQYDMAELLVEVGQTDQAIAIYRALEKGQPGFREAQVRIDEIEART